MEQVARNLEQIHHQIKAAAHRAGRQPEAVRLLAVTKMVGLADIKKAITAGIDLMGENRVQEFLTKWPFLPEKVEWHFIGTLQSNKVKYIYDKISLIHSLDRLSLARAVSKYARLKKQPIACLVEVNVAGEGTKQGVAKSELIPFVRRLAEIEGIRLKGLMTLAPYVADPEEVRWVFRWLREAAGEIAALGLTGVEMAELSMGMSNDFGVAVEEGATIIRVGSGIFRANR